MGCPKGVVACCTDPLVSPVAGAMSWARVPYGCATPTPACRGHGLAPRPPSSGDQQEQGTKEGSLLPISQRDQHHLKKPFFPPGRGGGRLGLGL